MFLGYVTLEQHVACPIGCSRGICEGVKDSIAKMSRYLYKKSKKCKDTSNKYLGALNTYRNIQLSAPFFPYHLKGCS